MFNPDKFEGKKDPVKSFNEFKEKITFNPLYLPRYSELKDAFSLIENSDMEKYDMETALSRLFVGNDLENTPFEPWNEEFVKQLGFYIDERIKDYKSKDTNTQFNILEVGARDGGLSYFLNDFINRKDFQKDKDLNFIASDNLQNYKKDWKELPNVPLEKIDYKKAIEKFRPSIVVCSYMPSKEDWTEFFRSKKFIKEYILIGDVEFFRDFQKTWGGYAAINSLGKTFLSSSDSNISQEIMNIIKQAEFYKDGFDMFDLKRLDNFQIDHSTYFYTKPLNKNEYKFSGAKSVSFRRRNN
ncbi:MAG: hypothetical protein US50_C0063G0002 [Candidatus Nomurabacteria bacterium GW2011_GWB1_37_5]|uniref:Uncharacterized protein n=1 Tax=Candidatus Nomurabacteria bacterium GW2011_GWB1_37_5 TaxID=1618742 RepID=A0A0G0GSP9_9BACT|nr:MAG: hypothetical protein US50_C0063G0002 [Candidatus Nomurabacteria bacterium GW2011_GWB1_37_5]